MTIKEQTKRFMELIKKSEEEIVNMINSGVMNSYIEAYAVVARKEVGFSIKEIKRLDFNSVFDFYGTKEAKNKANKIMLERNCKAR